MPDSRYYEPIYCKHERNVGYQGEGCSVCEQQKVDRLKMLQWAKGFTQERLLIDLLNSDSKLVEFGIYARTKDGKLILINTHNNLPKDLG